MKNTFLLRDEFMNWLVTIGKFPVPSAISYCSYVAAVDKTIVLINEEISQESNLFTELEPRVKNGNSPAVASIIRNLLDHMSSDKIEEQLNKPKSSIRKWKSALNQYQDFLYEYMETNIETRTSEEIETVKDSWDVNDQDEVVQHILTFVKNVSEDSSVKFVHEKGDIYANFRFRLITQDRFYDPIFYPIGFIKRLFYMKGDKEFMDSWLNAMLDTTTIHTEDGSVNLKTVHKLEIANGTVTIHTKGSLTIGYTKKSDNETLVPFSVFGLDNIVLDHEKPLAIIIKENSDNLPIFKEITVQLKKHIGRKITGEKVKKAANLVLKSEYIGLINIENLKSEMSLLSSLTHLQLMDGSENKKKGASL
ncbi:MAG: hypothetical protein ACOYNC_13615 [Bacteroidales bacterium]